MLLSFKKWRLIWSTKTKVEDLSVHTIGYTVAALLFSYFLGGKLSMDEIRQLVIMIHGKGADKKAERELNKKVVHREVLCT